MKFVKQGHRTRHSKCSASQKQQENMPPGTHETAEKHDGATENCSMEEQPVERERKEQSEYLQQIIKYLGSLRPNQRISPSYFQKQPDISQHMRAVLLNWLVDVHLKYKLQPMTLFINIHIIDAYLQKVVVRRNQLQLVGIAALWIASKYQQTYQVPKITNLIFICDSAYTKQQILDMESRIIKVLNFDLLFTTPLHYFEALNRIAAFQSKDYFLSRYLLELALFQMQFHNYSPKILACSVAYFVRKLRKNTNCWSQPEQQLFSVTEADLKQCARELCLFWQRAEGNQSLASLKTKFQSPNFKEVSKIRIGQAIKSQPQTHLRA